jgi:hypothetical protein
LASVVDDVQSKVAGLGLILKGNGHLNYQNTFWGANRSGPYASRSASSG